MEGLIFAILRYPVEENFPWKHLSGLESTVYFYDTLMFLFKHVSFIVQSNLR